MQGNNAKMLMSNKNKRAEMMALISADIAEATGITEPVETVESDASDPVDHGKEAVGKMKPLHEVVTHFKNEKILELDLEALKGHKINDVTEVEGYGDVTISASLNRLKVQPKVDVNLKDAEIRTLNAEAALAVEQGNIALAKELNARIDSLIIGESKVVQDSGKSVQAINLEMGRIEGSKHVFFRTQKGQVLFFDGVAYRFRATATRGLYDSETERPTARQQQKQALRDKKALEAKETWAAIRQAGYRQAKIEAAERTK